MSNKVLKISQPIQLNRNVVSIFDSFKNNFFSEFNDMFNSFNLALTNLDDKYIAEFGNSNFPKTDIYIKDKNLIFKSVLTGWNKEDIKVKFNKQNSSIEIFGKSSSEQKEEGKYLVSELKHSSFRRIWKLNFDLMDIDNSTAEFKDGYLKISIPSFAYHKQKHQEDVEQELEIK